MSLLRIIKAQLGLSVTPANNFTLDASADNGTMKLARGNAGATTQDILTVDAAGNVTSPSGAVGYGTGAGGTVTQLTSKATAVTLNKPTGKITTAVNALAADTLATFQLNNSTVAANDIVIITLADGNGFKYNAWAYAMTSGNCQIVLKNITAGSLSEAIPINFAIIKGATT